MKRTRKLDQLDEIDLTQPQTPSTKRARGLSVEQQQHEPARVPTHYQPGSPEAPITTSITSTISAEASNSSCTLTEAADRDIDGQIKHQSPSRHLSSGIQASDFLDNYHLSSSKSHLPNGTSSPDNYDVPSSRAEHLSGLEGHHFPDSYDIPDSSIHVPSGIERAYFPDDYDISPPPIPFSKGLKQIRSSSSCNLPSAVSTLHSSSNRKESSPTMTPEQAQHEFNKQYHFFNDPDARCVVSISTCIRSPCSASYSAKFWGCFEDT